METLETLQMQLGVHVTREERVQFEISDAIARARRWAPQSKTPNPIIQLLKQMNSQEEPGWLRTIEFGADRVGRHNNEEEKKYIHDLYEPISNDLTCRSQFANELSKAWKYGKASLLPLFDTVDDMRPDPRVEEETEKKLLQCEFWNPDTSDNPFLLYLESQNENKDNTAGWLRKGLFGRHRVKRQQNSEESERLLVLYSRARLPENSPEYFHSFVEALASAWGVSQDRLRKRLTQKKGTKSTGKKPIVSTALAPTLALSTSGKQVEIQEPSPNLVTLSNEEMGQRMLQPSLSPEPSSCLGVVTPTHGDDQQHHSSNMQLLEGSSRSITTADSQQNDLEDDMPPLLETSDEDEQEQDELQGFDTTAFKNIQDVQKCPTTGFYLLTQKSSTGRTITRRIMVIPNI